MQIIMDFLSKQGGGGGGRMRYFITESLELVSEVSFANLFICTFRSGDPPIVSRSQKRIQWTLPHYNSNRHIGSNFKSVQSSVSEV